MADCSGSKGLWGKFNGTDAGEAKVVNSTWRSIIAQLLKAENIKKLLPHSEGHNACTAGPFKRARFSRFVHAPLQSSESKRGGRPVLTGRGGDQC